METTLGARGRVEEWAPDTEKAGCAALHPRHTMAAAVAPPRKDGIASGQLSSVSTAPRGFSAVAHSHMPHTRRPSGSGKPSLGHALSASTAENPWHREILVQPETEQEPGIPTRSLHADPARRRVAQFAKGLRATSWLNPVASSLPNCHDLIGRIPVYGTTLGVVRTSP